MTKKTKLWKVSLTFDNGNLTCTVNAKSATDAIEIVRKHYEYDKKKVFSYDMINSIHVWKFESDHENIIETNEDTKKNS